jgi:hypothetical protein
MIDTHDRLCSVDPCHCEIIAIIRADERLNMLSREVCGQCNHPEFEHVLSVDRCNHPCGEDAHCTCTRFEVRP